MIGQNPKAGSTLFVSENRKKEYQLLGQQLAWPEVSKLSPQLRAKKQSRVSGQQLEWPDVFKLSPKLRGKAEIILDKKIKCLQAKLYRIPLARKKKKKYSQMKPVEKLSKP